MKDYGFKDEGWDYFAGNGWSGGIKVDRVDNDTDIFYTEYAEGYEKEDACSDILSIRSAERWIKEKAQELDYYKDSVKFKDYLKKLRKKLQLSILQRLPRDFKKADEYLSMIEQEDIADPDLLKETKLKKFLYKLSKTNFEELEPPEVDEYNLRGRAKTMIRVIRKTLMLKEKAHRDKGQDQEQ
ncbi:hypothetical protein HDV00_002807 [Rhizophlyctis rosea]|nr:hypothetical protein HDV00_002807 [Rhizophlyctis rosea]